MSHFKHGMIGPRSDDKLSKFKKRTLNKIMPAKYSSYSSNKSISPEKSKIDKMRSDKPNNSSLYDTSIKAGSVLDKFQSQKNYGSHKNQM